MSRPRGLSLLEVQIALMLLLVAVLTAVAMAPTGIRAVQQTERSTLTMAYARHLLESTMAVRFEHQYNVDDTALETTFPSAAPNVYRYRVDVAPLSSNPEIHSVMVTISWSDANANGTTSARSVKLAGYSAKLQ